MRASKRMMWVGNFYKLHTSSKISEEVSLQSMIFLSVKYMGFWAFFSVMNISFPGYPQ